MPKKIISLILSGVLSLQVGNFLTIANSYDGNEKTEKIEHIFENKEEDFCSAYPKNQCGNTVDVNCALNKGFRDLEESGTPFTDSKGIGPNCQSSLYLWRYNALEGLAKTFYDWINDENKDENKNRFINEFIGNTKKIFNTTNSDAAKIVNEWIQKSKYTKNIEVTKEDIEKWIKEMNDEEKIFENKWSSNWLASIGGIFGASTGWGITAWVAGTIFPPAAIPFGIAAGALGAVSGKYLGYSHGREAEEAQYRKKHIEEAKKHNIRLNVYSSGMEKIFHSIQRKEHIDNNLLVAMFNFDEYNHEARTFFVKKGTDSKNLNITKIFENLSNKLSKLMDKYNLDKEEI